MSDHKETKLEVVWRLPSELKTHPRFNVRPYYTSNGSAEREDKAIQDLAATIERDGQLDRIVIMPDGTVVIGHRRRKAAMLINEKRSFNGQELFRLECRIDPNPDLAILRRKGIVSNLQRENLSPMDIACLIETLRKENRWEGQKHTLDVANYFGISPASVTEYEKFLKYPAYLQQQLGLKVISAHSAKRVMEHVEDPKLQVKVLDRAVEIQQEDTLDKYLDAASSNVIGPREAHRKINAAMNNNHVEHPAVKKAIREVINNDAKGKPLRRDYGEFLAGLSKLNSDRYPEAARKFIDYSVNRYAAGFGDDQDLRNIFEAIWQDQ